MLVNVRFLLNQDAMTSDHRKLVFLKSTAIELPRVSSKSLAIILSHVKTQESQHHAILSSTGVCGVTRVKGAMNPRGRPISIVNDLEYER